MSMALTIDLTDLVRESLGDPLAEIADQHAELLDHGPGMLSTASLHRVHGTTTSGATWSFFVKSIHAIRHWAGYATVPEHLRPAIEAHFPWRADADVYLARPELPAGLRLPRMYRLDDLGDDRLVMWLEYVHVAAAAWDLDRYRRAARLLGDLAVARPVAGRSSGPREPLNRGLHYYRSGPLANVFLPAMRDPATWRNPLVAENADPLLRADLLALAERIDPLLEALDRLPHTLVHGDAGPGNLLIPADGSAEFVAIDWSWPYPAAVGFDLGQLLVGRAHTGELHPEDLPAVHEAIEVAYAAPASSLADPGEISFGYVASLVLRSAWTAIPFEMLGQEPTPELHELFRKRAGLARFIVDLGRSLP
ncbi:phosphotransferase [Nonomuraea sp. SYSU D8015]|uniref:phosphotransferase n=1 Tax=Nonomuraea sp. SYSU D8015 TaxID=2593644 RepID=UPI001661593B|nr:phosphotransferase [Nonomuraea sp. SYSU D8015]